MFLLPALPALLLSPWTRSPALLTLLLLPGMILLLEVGRRLRRRRGEAEVSGSVEGAIFALLGLLLAFSFSGAVSRYDNHRLLAIEEANEIETAYLRLDLLPSAEQPELRGLFRQYVVSRLHLFDGVREEISPETRRLQYLIWKKSVTAVAEPGAKPDASRLLLPAVNDMLGITVTRRNAFYMHPPMVVYWLLFIFSGISALTAGYGMKRGLHEWIYPVVLSAAVTMTIFTIVDIDSPRNGVMIQLHKMDEPFQQVLETMR